MQARLGPPLLRLRDWLFRLRGTQATPIVINYRRIYLMPSGAGVAYCAGLLLMLMASINYALSLGLVMTFLLGGTMLASAMRGFRNVLGIEIDRGRSDPVFCGEAAQFSLMLRNHSTRERYVLSIEADAGSAMLDALAGGESNSLVLRVPTEARGYLTLPWVRLQTRFPMGLVDVWTYVRPNMRTLVYPRPEDRPPPLPRAAGQTGHNQASGPGTDDFFGLRAWRAADSPRHIAWKIAARDGPLMVKQFSGIAGGKVVLAWDALPAQMHTEEKLSRLTAWVCKAHQAGVRWHLITPEANLGPASGPEHYRACLTALALHGQSA